MLSLAGRRPGARLYAREDKPSHRSKTTSPSYLRPLHRSYRVEALGPDSIKPLVELGFWSKSVEVRRDSAAALSTLARNPDNLGTLGRSGALGATLSLLISTDDACVRDATLTLGQLVQCVELADRFMERTGGLETVLGLLRSPAPRPALVVVANLACQRGAADANESEMLSFAFLVVYNAGSVGTLNEWAKNAALEKTAAVMCNLCCPASQRRPLSERT